MSTHNLRAALPGFAKKYVWNLKYAILGYPLFDPPADAVELLSGSLREDSFLLELGCGRGSLLRGLRQKGWSGTYCGVDLSREAIRHAMNMGDQRSSWVVSGIETFQSPFQWNVIALIESIYYIDLGQLPAVLEQLAGMLKDPGSLLIRIHDPAKHSAYIDTLCRVFPKTQQVNSQLFHVPVRNL